MVTSSHPGDKHDVSRLPPPPSSPLPPGGAAGKEVSPKSKEISSKMADVVKQVKSALTEAVTRQQSTNRVTLFFSQIMSKVSKRKEFTETEINLLDQLKALTKELEGIDAKVKELTMVQQPRASKKERQAENAYVRANLYPDEIATLNDLQNAWVETKQACDEIRAALSKTALKYHENGVKLKKLEKKVDKSLKGVISIPGTVSNEIKEDADTIRNADLKLQMGGIFTKEEGESFQALYMKLQNRLELEKSKGDEGDSYVQQKIPNMLRDLEHLLPSIPGTAAHQLRDIGRELEKNKDNLGSACKASLKGLDDLLGKYGMDKYVQKEAEKLILNFFEEHVGYTIPQKDPKGNIYYGDLLTVSGVAKFVPGEEILFLKDYPKLNSIVKTSKPLQSAIEQIQSTEIDRVRAEETSVGILKRYELEVKEIVGSIIKGNIARMDAEFFINQRIQEKVAEGKIDPRDKDKLIQALTQTIKNLKRGLYERFGIRYDSFVKWNKLRNRTGNPMYDRSSSIGDKNKAKLKKLSDGVFIQYGDEVTYRGSERGGIPNGKGKLITPDSEYQGNFKNGRFHGKGELRFDDGLIYKGEFKDGIFVGKPSFNPPVDEAEAQAVDEEGVAPVKVARQPTVVEEEQPKKVVDPAYDRSNRALITSESRGSDGLPFVRYADGASYLGQMRDGVPHGQGNLTLKNGDAYIGGFKGGKPHDDDALIIYKEGLKGESVKFKDGIKEEKR